MFAIDTLGWLSKRLILFVVNLPLDLVIAALAEQVKGCFEDSLREFTVIVNPE